MYDLMIRALIIVISINTKIKGYNLISDNY